MTQPAGLKDYLKRKAAAQQQREERANKKYVDQFRLEGDGDSVVVRFAQEIDYEAKNYNPDLGIGWVNIEHINGADPQGWRTRANCTLESQGACFPCEKASDYSLDSSERNRWKQKERFIINVIGGPPREEKYKSNGKDKTRKFTTSVDKATGDGHVYALAQGTYNGIFDALSEYFLEEDISGGTITDKFFKITRKGTDTATSYTVMPLKDLPADAKPLSEFELIDLAADIAKEVPYAQQEAYYYQGMKPSAPASKPETTSAAPSATDADDVW